MTPAADDDIAAAQSSVPLLSRRRGSLATSVSSDRNDAGAGDIEQGAPGGGVVGGAAAEDSIISVRVKTAGDGREYKVSSSLTTTVAQGADSLPPPSPPPPSETLGSSLEHEAEQKRMPDFKTDVSRVIGAEGKYLRLISAGKMLNPDEAQVKDFGLTENCYVHCVVTAAPPRLHLPSLTPAQAEEETQEGEDDDPATRRGFDGLRNNGMTRGEVTAIRGYFSSQVRQYATTLPASERENQTDWDRQLEVEELWMRAQPPTSEFALNVSMARRSTGQGGSLTGLDGFDGGGSSGGTRDFMFGFAMGAFLGVIMLLWMWEAAVPRKQKLGILAGVTFKQTANMVQAAVSSRGSKGED